MSNIQVAIDNGSFTPPSQTVPDAEDSPVKVLNGDDLMKVGSRLRNMFNQYKYDRRLAELRWLRSQRQYLGVYDPDVEEELSPNRSRAYPRVTRVKIISVLSRLMNLMFQGEERNWTLKATPSPDLTQEDVEQALSEALTEAQENNEQPEITDEFVDMALQKMADQRANQLMTLIDDQLQELGGDQTQDYVALNRSVVRSGLTYGLGVLRGPFAIKSKKTVVKIDAKTKQPQVKTVDIYKPLFELRSIWDFYPDMAAKSLANGDGFFERMVMSRSQVLALTKREDFIEDQIRRYLTKDPVGNYIPLEFEQQLRVMGLKANVNEKKMDSHKYEVIAWHGPLSGQYLAMCGVDVDDDKLADEIDAEVWFIDDVIIKAVINPWRELGVDVRTMHYFLFDEDDTSPVGQGIPTIMRDSQMSVSALARMYLDNASVVCGPQLELNTDLLREEQDVYSTTAYKIWYRTGTGPEAQFPAVRAINIDAHLSDLERGIDLWMKFADAETFVGPATGGDMSQTPSEPMRTAVGASMMRGDAALPFKDIVRSFDKFTQSVIESLIQFNRRLNPDVPGVADYNVIARGATSLIAKEVRGMQVDQIAQSLSPEEKEEVNMRRVVEERMATRDLRDMMLPEDEVKRNRAQKAQQAAAQQALADALSRANERKLLADAFKNIAQGTKNTAAADANAVDTALKLLEQGDTNATGSNGGEGKETPGNIDAAASATGVRGVLGLPGLPGGSPGAMQGSPLAGDAGNIPGGAG